MLKLHDYVIYADSVFIECHQPDAYRVLAVDNDGYFIKNTEKHFLKYKDALKYAKIFVQNRDFRTLERYTYRHKPLSMIFC